MIRKKRRQINSATGLVILFLLLGAGLILIIWYRDSFLSSFSPLTSQKQPTSSLLNIIDSPGFAKLSSRLQIVVKNQNLNEEQLAKLLGLSVSGPGSLSKNSQGDLLVEIRVKDVTINSIQKVESFKAEVINVAENYNIITAYVSKNKLISVAELPFVKNIQEILSPSMKRP